MEGEQTSTTATLAIDPVLEWLLRERLPGDGVGVSVAVVQGGRVRQRAGYGLAVREWSIAPDPATVFALGSITKPFTALALLRLVAAGCGNLDDSLTTYLPDYRDPSGEITLRHVLTHTSGIPNYVTQPGYWPHVSRLDHSPAQVRALFENRPLDFAPGTRYSYSNAGYFLLALVIEAVTGRRYEEYVCDEVLRPLGMANATFFDDAHLIPRRALGYQPPAWDGREDAEEHTPDDTHAGFRQARYVSATLLRGNGGLAASLDDLLAFDEALRSGHLLPPDLWAEMVRPARLADGSERGYGLGWGLSTVRGKRVIHHAGGIPGYSSFYGHFPDDDLSLSILANRTGFDCADLARALAVAALNLASPTRVTVALSEEVTARMLGRYHNVIGEEVILEREGERLVWLSEDRKREVVPIGVGLLQAVDDPDVTLRFEGDAADGYLRVCATVPFYWFIGERER